MEKYYAAPVVSDFPFLPCDNSLREPVSEAPKEGKEAPGEDEVVFWTVYQRQKNPIEVQAVADFYGDSMAKNAKAFAKLLNNKSACMNCQVHIVTYKRPFDQKGGCDCLD